jgi:molybdopterin biosynthesis enzyme
MVKAHGFAIIPEDSEGVEEGDEIDVLILRSMGCFHA